MGCEAHALPRNLNVLVNIDVKSARVYKQPQRIIEMHKSKESWSHASRLTKNDAFCPRYHHSNDDSPDCTLSDQQSGNGQPDTPPPKFMTILDQLGPLKLSGLGISICFVQPRFILLILAGASIISEASLPASESFIAVLVLALLMVWVMLVPIVAFLVMGKHRNEAMKSMREWLISNQRIINVIVMTFFGILMILLGLNHIV